MANGDLRGSLDQLQKLLSSKDADSLSKESKQQACELSYKLFRELQEPGDLATRIVFQVSRNGQRSHAMSSIHTDELEGSRKRHRPSCH